MVFVSWKPLGDPPAQANLALAIVLLAVFFIQAAFNAWQDWSSSRVMASITTMLPDNCLVLRDRSQITIVANEIVPGDILYIKSGNKLPADVRFIEISSDAKFDRSILTGTSMHQGDTRQHIMLISSFSQVNLFHFREPLRTRIQIIWRLATSVCKELIVYLAVVSALSLLLEISA